jgi:hypothetical protein
MSVGTRIVFTRFTTIHSAKLVAWQEHTRRVAGMLVESIDELDLGPVIVWKLASANNRTLGRSAELYPSFEEARVAAGRFVDCALRLEARSASNELSGAYGWFLSDDAVPAMTCSRWYSTSRDRNQSLHLARLALSLAVLETGARPIDVLPYGADA